MQPERQFQKYQELLADYCRTDQYHELPGVTSEERVRTYRRLIFNGFDDTLRKAYPITFKVLGEKEFSVLVNKFCSEFPSGSPQLWKMPHDLLQFVEQSRYSLDRFPYLRDLLEFEWVEIEVQMMPDLNKSGDIAKVNLPVQDVLRERLVVNLEHKVVELTYPVFRLPLEQIKKIEGDPKLHAGNYFLLTFRDPLTDKVHYTELSSFSLLALDALTRLNCTGLEAVKEAMRIAGLIESEKIMIEAAKIFETFLDIGFILGSNK